jgi:hypothetical protein
MRKENRMSKEIEAQVKAEIDGGSKFEVGEWGLTFKDQLTPKDWIEAVWELQKFDGKIQWYLGDLAVYAESQVTGWGESKYDDLVNATGYEPQTMRTFASIARRFPAVWRENVLSQDNKITVSWTHFKAVAPLEDNFAVYWLQKAGENGWGVAKLREEIRKWREERGEITEKAEAPLGYTSFKEVMKGFFNGYVPNLSQEEYDEKSWLLEVHDVIEERLHDLGIEL